MRQLGRNRNNDDLFDFSNQYTFLAIRHKLIKNIKKKNIKQMQ